MLVGFGGWVGEKHLWEPEESKPIERQSLIMDFPQEQLTVILALSFPYFVRATGPTPQDKPSSLYLLQLDHFSSLRIRSSNKCIVDNAMPLEGFGF